MYTIFIKETSMEKAKIIKFLPLAAIIFMWLLLSSPYLLRSKIPYPADYQINTYTPWSMYEEFWGPVKNAAIPDVITEIYPWRIFTVEALKQGKLPLWNPYSFGGTPHLANYQSGVFFPGNLLFFVLPNIESWSLIVLLQPLVAGIGMYIFSKSQGVGKVGVVISSLAFMFCGFITVWMPYATLPWAIIPLPYILYCTIKYFSTQNKRYLFCVSLLTAFSFSSAHFQTSLYCLLTSGAFILYVSYTRKDLKSAVTLSLALLSGFLLMMVQIIPTLEFYKTTARLSFTEVREAIPLNYFPTIFAPDFFGNPVSRNDFFGHYAEWCAYTGIIPLLLAVYAAVKKKAPFFIILAISALFLAYDTPFATLLVHSHFPVLSNSSLSRIIILFSFATSLLAGFGYDEVLSDIKKRRSLPLVVIGSLGIVIILTLLLSVYLQTPDYKGISLRNSVIPISLILLTIFAIGASTVSRKHASLILITLPILVGFEMIRFTTKWMPQANIKDLYPKTTLEDFYPNVSPDRILANITAENSTYYHVPTLTGYDPLYPKDVAEIIEYARHKDYSNLPRTTVMIDTNGIYTPKLIDITQIRYILFKKEDKGKIWAFPFNKYPLGQFRRIFEDSEYEVYENTKYIGRAIVFYNYLVANNDTDIKTIFSNPNVGVKTVVIEKEIDIPQHDIDPTEAKIKVYQPENVEIEVNAKESGILYLPDTFFPGWKVGINGQEKEILRTNHAFRGVIVPQGKSSVQFYYVPESLKIGAKVSFIGFILLLGILLWPTQKKT